MCVVVWVVVCRGFGSFFLDLGMHTYRSSSTDLDSRDGE